LTAILNRNLNRILPEFKLDRKRFFWYSLNQIRIMCIIAYKPKGATLLKSVLKTCYKNNGDGCGIAYPDDKGESMIVQRGMFSFKELWKMYRDIPKEKPILLHFRIGTSGEIDEKNCHPFLIDEKHALVHNGNIESKLDNKDNSVSDTNHFVEKILRPIFQTKLKKNFWSGFAFKWLMEGAIESKNKMVILAADGHATIYNEQAGEWENEVWFSNKTYKEDRKSATGATVSTYIENGWLKEITTFANGKKCYRWVQPVNELEAGTTPILQKDKDKKEEVSEEMLEKQFKHSLQLSIGEIY